MRILVRSGLGAIACALLCAAPAAAVVPPYGPGPSSDYSEQDQPAAGSCHYWATPDGTPRPDPLCTPGALNPTVTQRTVADTICRANYADSIRPPRALLRSEQRHNAESYGYTGDLAVTEYDYVVPLELGGDPNDPRNLWVEPRDHARKNDVERRLNALVCTGKLPLVTAQEAIAHDWTTALPR